MGLKQKIAVSSMFSAHDTTTTRVHTALKVLSAGMSKRKVNLALIKKRLTLL